MKIKIGSALLLLVFGFLIAEDVFAAHSAAAEDDSMSISHILAFHAKQVTTNNPSHHNESSNTENHCSDFSSSHFGHCGFLLLSSELLVSNSDHFSSCIGHYAFTLKLAIATNLLRPPIFA